MIHSRSGADTDSIYTNSVKAVWDTVWHHCNREWEENPFHVFQGRSETHTDHIPNETCEHKWGLSPEGDRNRVDYLQDSESTRIEKHRCSMAEYLDEKILAAQCNGINPISSESCLWPTVFRPWTWPWQPSGNMHQNRYTCTEGVCFSIVPPPETLMTRTYLDEQPLDLSTKRPAQLFNYDAVKNIYERIYDHTVSKESSRTRVYESNNTIPVSKNETQLQQKSVATRTNTIAQLANKGFQLKTQRERWLQNLFGSIVNRRNDRRSEQCFQINSASTSRPQLGTLPRKTIKLGCENGMKPVRRAYTEAELSAAVRAICLGRLGTRRAASVYGIPRSTLRNKICKLNELKKREEERQGGKAILMPEFLQTLLYHLKEKPGSRLYNHGSLRRLHNIIWPDSVQMNGNQQMFQRDEQKNTESRTTESKAGTLAFTANRVASIFQVNCRRNYPKNRSTRPNDSSKKIITTVPHIQQTWPPSSFAGMESSEAEPCHQPSPVIDSFMAREIFPQRNGPDVKQQQLGALRLMHHTSSHEVSAYSAAQHPIGSTVSAFHRIKDIVH